MSRITLAPNASGTGTLTVAAPNTNTDRTLTLPDVTTTLVGTDATQTLTNKSIASSQLTGALPAIDGSALTGLPDPTTAQVGTAMAGLTAGGVGSYSFLWRSGTSAFTYGSTLAGSSLQPASAGPTPSGGTVSGTWRCLGYISSGSTTTGAVTLWQRIS